MRYYKRKKGYYVCGEHLGDPIYAPYKKYSLYMWRKTLFDTMKEIPYHARLHKEPRNKIEQ